MGGCTSRNGADQAVQFPRLSSVDEQPVGLHYEVVVIGSGYGASIAACRAARAGKSVCVLEKGKEWQPGDFPETLLKARKELAINVGGKYEIGHGVGLFDLLIGDDVSVLRGCGLGGTSLINANVILEADEKLYKHAIWPEEFRNDFDNFREDIQRARDMLRPEVYPKPTKKEKRMEELASGLKTCDVSDIEDLHEVIKFFRDKPDNEAVYKVPLCVNFKDKPVNHVGIPQPPCNGCGNCCGGCNVGAKSTTDKNYLADAKYNGASIFTKVKVIAIKPSDGSGKWQICYQRFYDGEWRNESQVVTADIVILGAGSIGSTEILLRSRENENLPVSSHLGKGFSGNGDQLGVTYANDELQNSMGIESDFDPNKTSPPGPTITSVLDFRATKEEEMWRRGFIMQDGTPPSCSVTLLRYMLAIGQFSAFDYDPSDDWDQLVSTVTGSAMNKTLPLLAMGYDDVEENGDRHSGTISLAEKGVDVKWPETAEKPYYKNVHETYKLAAKLLGGKYVPNPGWSKKSLPIFDGRNTITVHPLGGCVMGETGQHGVVNHKGQVFKGDGSEVHKGLYVMDGAVLPHSVGVNPALTICGVAERCMRLLADDYHWGQQNYEFLSNPETVDWATRVTGVKVDEYMGGKFKPFGDSKETCKIECNFTLMGNDLAYFLYGDKNHRLLLDGTVRCQTLSSKPMTIKGHLDMFVRDHDLHGTVEKQYMWYRAVCKAHDSGKDYFFHARKEIKKDTRFEIGWVDTTSAMLTMFEGTDQNGKVVGEAKISMGPLDLLKAVKGIQITNPGPWIEEIKWKIAFQKLFLGQVWRTYSPFSQGLKINPEAPPREKRSLKIPDTAHPEVYEYITEDEHALWLTRYKGGNKGPVILSHGLGVSSEIFLLDTVETNFVEYLLANGYDVWCMEWRGSVVTPYAEVPFTLDDVAQYDYPAAVDKVLEVTGMKDVQIVAHCVGSQTFFASLLSGHLQGKIRSVISSQVAYTPIPSTFNKLKAGLRFPTVAEKMGLTTMDDEERGLWYDKLINGFSKVVSGIISPHTEECKNYVDHRVTMIYGRLWNHENLNGLTHDTLHEVFGPVNSTMLKNLARIMRAKHLVSHDGKEIYLPDIEKGMKSENYRKHMKFLDIPICFTNGVDNVVFDPKNMKRSYFLAKEANPEQYYEWVQMEDYGHLEAFLAKDAATRSFPKLLPFLEKYATAQDFPTVSSSQSGDCH